ncbi:MAG: hypothetical protein JW888_18485, partial [Pirellulales bacterium]|nr:hypothetical protein [Pirellulales bacterium]
MMNSRFPLLFAASVVAMQTVAACAPVGADDAAPKHVAISAAETIAGTRVFDETTVVRVAPGATLVKGADGRLVFKGSLDAPREHIVRGFKAGDVRFEPGSHVDGGVAPEWWGAAGADDPASAAANVEAIHAALAATAG